MQPVTRKEYKKIVESGKYDIVLPPMRFNQVKTLSAIQTPSWGYNHLKFADVKYLNPGQGTIIFILDTAGATTHPDLVQRWEPRYSENFTNDQEATDGHGHGHHCAGIALATDNATGVVGGAHKARLGLVKVLNNKGGGAKAWIARAIRWVADLELLPQHEGYRKIISLSLGSQFASVDVQEAAKHAISKGCFLVAAAGNSGNQGDTNTVLYPARWPEFIAIASYDQDGKVSGFSSQGEEVEFSMPGHDILSLVPPRGQAAWSGTSMACPHAAALIAIAVQFNPWIKTQEEMRTFLKSQVTDIHLPGFDIETGHGTVFAPDIINASEPEPEEPEKPEPENPSPDPGKDRKGCNPLARFFK